MIGTHQLQESASSQHLSSVSKDSGYINILSTNNFQRSMPDLNKAITKTSLMIEYDSASTSEKQKREKSDWLSIEWCSMEYQYLQFSSEDMPSLSPATTISQ